MLRPSQLFRRIRKYNIGHDRQSTQMSTKWPKMGGGRRILRSVLARKTLLRIPYPCQYLKEEFFQFLCRRSRILIPLLSSSFGASNSHSSFEFLLRRSISSVEFLLRRSIPLSSSSFGASNSHSSVEFLLRRLKRRRERPRRRNPK